MRKIVHNFYHTDDIKKLISDTLKESKILTQADSSSLLKKIENISKKIDRNQKALEQIDDVARILRDNEQNLKNLDQINESARIIQDNEQNLKNLDQISESARIIQDNEQNLKDLGGLKRRLDLLDKIYIKIDSFVGEIKTTREQQELNSKTLSNHDERIEKLEKHTKIPHLTT